MRIVVDAVAGLVQEAAAGERCPLEAGVTQIKREPLLHRSPHPDDGEIGPRLDNLPDSLAPFLLILEITVTETGQAYRRIAVQDMPHAPLQSLLSRADKEHRFGGPRGVQPFEQVHRHPRHVETVARDLLTPQQPYHHAHKEAVDEHAVQPVVQFVIISADKAVIEWVDAGIGAPSRIKSDVRVTACRSHNLLNQTKIVHGNRQYR